MFLTSLCFDTYSQLNNPELIRGGFSDAQLLFDEYLKPWVNCFGADLNGGWYNTAKAHEPLGFDLTINVSTALAPSSLKTFDLNGLNLEGNVIGTLTTTPTIAGKGTEERPVIRYEQLNPLNSEPVTIAEYKVPNGTGINFLPLPMVQLGLGIYMGTELTVRFLPNTPLGQAGNIGLWGVGLKHSISQWIPVFKEVPFLNIAVQGGYTKLSSYANLRLNVDERALNRVSDNLIFKNQKFEFEAEAYTVNLIASQNFPGVSFYQGLGYSASNVFFGLKGNFPLSRLETDSDSEDFGKVVVTDNDIYKDPFKIMVQNTENLRINAGIRFKIGILTLHFDYTRANYNIFTAGVGVSYK